MKPYTEKTLAELLTMKDETIWRNATSIYKRLRKLDENGTLDAISETVRCNNCMTIYPSEVSTCTKCGTDKYLMDNYIN